MVFSQSIEITSFSTNPVEINPLVGGNVIINYKYSSETGSAGNHIYLALELLDGTNSFKKTIAEITLENQQAGTNVTGVVNLFISSNNILSANLDTGYYYQVKSILFASGGWTGIAWSGYWNTPSILLQDTSAVVPRTDAIIKGVDVSWMSEMESSGFVWKDNAGITKNLMPLLNQFEINAVRLRVWVDPSISEANGWCDIPDLVYKAKLASAEGMDVMVCIHYSDYWADPGQQNKPAAWDGLTVAELETAIYNHTTNILTALAAEGITPKWVQLGNETNNGLLWPTGKPSINGFSNYAKFIAAGNNAVKNFNSTIKTIVHLSNGYDNNLYQWNIGGLISSGAQFDIIGMSLYPDSNNWINLVNDTYSNMIDMKSRYGKEVMISEVGFNSTTPNIAYQFLVFILEKTREAGGLGVFYWEPIAHNGWKSYSKGAWDSDGSPSVAMDAFVDFKTLSIGDKSTFDFDYKGLKFYPNPVSKQLIITVINKQIVTLKIFDIFGRELKAFTGFKSHHVLDVSDLPKGIYLLTTNTKETFRFITY
ncbi:glycosyl hydrolase 53 family protein [Mariniflexile aquimaris]|uniref:Arabinogalactan endo-beta-1,4-galactanase n=1 Tax=Mariniflexile aquimaris TaxID=881009 RepID=A0ABW3BU44_9FLAO